MRSFDSTVRFSVDNEKGKKIQDIMTQVYKALDDKGYNPVNQIVGYLLSGDPAYITSHQEARITIRQIERDEILEVLLNNYLETKKIK